MTDTSPLRSGIWFISIALALASATPAASQTLRLDLPSPYLAGYARAIKGEELTYHSPLPTVDRSLLVRSLNRAYDIAWETAAVPDDFAADTAVFVFMAGIDVQQAPRQFDLFVNGRELLHIRNPRQAEPGVIGWEGDEGIGIEFRVTEIDKYDDAMGFMFLRVPRRHWERSRSLRLRVAGESAGVRTWFMVFMEPIAPHVTLRNAPALLRTERGAQQAVRVDALHLEWHGRLSMASPLGRIDTALTLGLNRLEIPVAAVEREVSVALRLEVDGHQVETTFTVAPVKPMAVYLLHHTHLDIGYTHHQDDVERLQWGHLENAIRYGEASEQLPDGARFVWNPEGLWAVESYLATHGAEQRERLLQAIRRGWIHLDAMFGNLLTGIASSEGLMRSLEAARRLSAQTGVPIRSAMLSDIPGFTWGLVPVLAQHGVKYLTIGPNFGHRVGYFLDTWGDQPFYWESPSGRERVLTWVSAAGYAWFHSGLGYERITTLLTPENVFRYLDRLTESGYPYDITYMRYNIGSDNGPPDPNLAETVRAWNERYVSPRLIISGTTGLFEAFEERYGGELPVYRGDLTGHWEDGAASSARETALVRRTAESLVQTEVLAAMLGSTLPEEDLSRAWRNVTLFYEHTWGSWNSISEPEAEFTLRQWATKKAFADSAARLAERLRRRAESRRFDPSSKSQAIAVYNTLSWPRTDVVTLPAALSVVGDRVVDATGRVVPSQRLNTGELALLAEAVPAFDARRYVIEGGEVPVRGDAMAGRNVIGNHRVRVEVDTLRGTIRSLRYVPADRELAGDAALNQYLYVSGRDPANSTTNGPVTVRVVEGGPLVAAIEVQADAPGTRRGIRSEIRLYAGLDRVDIVNAIDKALEYDPEAVLYRFDFDLPSPEVRVDIPWGSYRPEADQLPGSCKNYLSVQRWVDIHDRQVGVTVTTIDAPMIQLGAIRTDPIVAGWDQHLAPSGTLYSYAMNNYWETNYRAGQEGSHELRYSITPHLAFEEAEAERVAMGIAQPLIAVPVDPAAPPVEPPFEIEARRAVATFLRRTSDGEALMLRLYNPSAESDTVRFRWPAGERRTVYRSDVFEDEGDALPDEVELGPYQILTVRIAVRDGQ